MLMLVAAFVAWWYGGGWSLQMSEVAAQFRRTADFFSIGLLLKTLINPFKGISGEVPSQGPLGVMARAWFDRQLSRAIGAVIRLFTVLAGGLVILAVSLAGALRLIIWPLLPLLPPVLAVLWLIGWVPWRQI